MPIEIKAAEAPSFLKIHCSGRVRRADYLAFAPRFDAAVKEGGAQRVLFDLTDFEGWGMGALWEELKFDVRHYADIEKCAVLGDKKWEQELSSLFKPFTRAKVRYFGQAEAAGAKAWLLDPSAG